MHGLLHAFLMAYMAITIQTHSGGCADRATLEYAWTDAQYMVITGDYPGRALAACGILEDDPDVVYVLDVLNGAAVDPSVLLSR